MLSEFQVYNTQGSLLSLPLGEVTEGIVVAGIDGLDPVKATVVSSSFASLDGEQYHASRRDKRNIKVQLDLDPDYINADPRDVRQLLYGYFMPKSTVDLRFVMDDSTGYNISGLVESFEAPLFTNEPKVNISILCFDPDFLLSTEDQYADVTYYPLMSVSSTLTTNINNPGTVETGILFSFTPDRAIDEFSLYNTPENGLVQQMDFTVPMLAFDTLQVSTIPGKKKVELYRASSLVGSVLYGLSPQSAWIELMPGDNAFRMYEDGAPLDYLVGHYTRYGGL